MSRPKTTVRRVTTSLRAQDEENLTFIATCTGLSENDSIRKALATEAVFQGWLAAGSTLMAMNKGGKIRELVFVG